MALPSRGECQAALRGFAAVLRGDSRAAGFYDLSVEGFGRSFWPVALLTIPYTLLLEPLAASTGAVTGPAFLLGQFLLQLATWLGYVALMTVFCRAFGLTGGYAVFVILYNWAQAIVMLATLPVLALTAWGVLPPGTPLGWSGLMLLVWVYAVVRIARLALQATPGAAILATLLDLAVTVILHRVVDLIL